MGMASHSEKTLDPPVAPAAGPEDGADGSTWLSQGERGTVFVIWATFRLATLVGRRTMRPIVSFIALWYRLFDRKATGASRDWLRRVHGREPAFWEVYRHLRTFVQVTLDRVFLLLDETKGLEFTRTGHRNLSNQVATGRGAVLLGAHCGSYEAMRAGGVEDRVPINILGYFENARRINALLAKLNDEQAARVIHLGSDPVGAAMKARAAVERGEFIAILGDRVGLNDRTVKATFFGQEAEFPTGPFLLASILNCPVYMVFGLYHEPGRYDLYCEPFAERIVLPRKDREAGLQELVERYAQRLEAFCRRAPHNWFNFFDFWRRT